MYLVRKKIEITISLPFTGGPYDADKAYKDSKLCNMLFMAEASRRLAPRGVSVNAFSPGLIADPNGFFRNQVNAGYKDR